MPKKNEKKSKRKAVIIGINKYQDKENIPALEGAVNDATEIHDVLKKWGTFEIADNHFLLDEGATCSVIRRSINDLLIRTVPYDFVLLYFSGHGIVDGYGNGYIVPFDMIKSEPFVNGISMEELRKVILGSVQKKVLMILDCCYSGIAAKGEKTIAIEDVKDPFEEYFTKLKDEEGGEGKIIMTSSEKDKKSREKTDLKLDHEDNPHAHGIFTFHILEGLFGYGTANKKGIITLASLKKYVSDKLKERGLKPKFYIDYSDSLDNFEIGIAPIVPKIEKKLKKVAKHLKGYDIEDIIIACEYLHEVSKYAELNPKFNKLKKTACKKLTKLQDDAFSWIPITKIALKKKAGLENLYSELYQLSNYLDFDKINDILNTPYAALLANLCNAINKNWELDTFIQRTMPIIQQLIRGPLPDKVVSV